MTDNDPLAVVYEAMDSLDAMAENESDDESDDAPDDELDGTPDHTPARARARSGVRLDDVGSIELHVEGLPQQADEFRCTRCWLVLHRSQRAAAGGDVCTDCS